MIEPATQTLLACPQCARAMDHLTLAGHGAAPVVVDHCGPCRLVWFDALESVQLAGLGWVRLLRELQRGARDEPLAPRGTALGCPVCRQPLKSVHNLTRYGRFPALECPQQHGHLHSQAGVLAERGLVRPLLAPERDALARHQRVLHCFNCGARAEGKSEACSYCASPLMVIDVPRLTHALLRKPGDDTRSPLPDGVPLAWNCHACGAALDPSRDASCPQCGQGVLAPSLVDLNPLLVAIETRLQQAEQAARPYHTKPKRPRHWQETGLGMLYRFWRADDDEPRQRAQGWSLWLIVAVFAVWMLLIRR
ncbi:MAG: hypothetical protein U1E89_20270 [Burkholderiaceae bacterium]